MTRPRQVSAGAAVVAQYLAQARRAVEEVQHQLRSSPQELEAAAKRYEEILVAVREGLTDPFRPAPGIDQVWYGATKDRYLDSSRLFTAEVKRVGLHLEKAPNHLAEVARALTGGDAEIKWMLRQVDEVEAKLKAKYGRAQADDVNLRNELQQVRDSFVARADAVRTRLRELLAGKTAILEEITRNAREWVRCPFKRFGGDLKAMVSESEQYRRDGYNDGYGNLTIGIGFNADRGNAMESLARFFAAHPQGITDANKAAAEVLAGTRRLTNEQVNQLFEQDMRDARENLFKRGITRSAWDRLSPAAQAALLDVSFTRPAFFVEKGHREIVDHINQGRYAEAAEVIDKWAKSMEKSQPGNLTRHQQNATMLRNGEACR